MLHPEGTELIAELPQVELDAAVSQLVPAHFVPGEDGRTPNQIRVYQRARERAAALLWELPPGTTLFDLHAQTRAFSLRARTIVWDSSRHPSSALTSPELGAAAEALRSLLDRLVPATDRCTASPDYVGKNPRTGEPIFVAGERVIGVMLQPPP